LLARAQKMTGPGGDVIDDFRALFADADLVYRPATTRLYQQQVKAVIARKLSDGELSKERAIAGFAEIKALLKARRGSCPKRTSRRKLKSGTYAEFRAIVGDFARRSRLPGGLDRTDTVLSMLVKVGPYLGLRPCEWVQAAIFGQTLHVLNAKSSNGRALGEVRVIGLGGLPLKIITLVSHLIPQVRLLFAEAGNNWRKILGRLGERLARVCARIGVRRWSLYTTRHAAIANWKRASLSDAEIAALAGHSSMRTARQHYASGRHGWTAEFACARPDPALVAGIVAHHGLTTAPLSATGETIRVVPVCAVARANISLPSSLPAAIPHRVIGVEKKDEKLPIIPIIKRPVLPIPSCINSIWEPDERPALGMD
jgi:integrase